MSTGVGAHGLPMEPAAKPAEEAPKLEPGETASFCHITCFSSGLARVHHLPVVAWPVLEALPKTPTATPNAVVIPATSTQTPQSL